MTSGTFTFLHLFYCLNEFYKFAKYAVVQNVMHMLCM